MQRIEVATDVYVDPETAYEFLLDFPGYARYSEYLEEVRAHGDGGPGTEYDLRFSWWRIGYTARSAVTDVDPPEEIEWEVVRDVAARGRWVVEPPDDERSAVETTDGATSRDPTTDDATADDEATPDDDATPTDERDRAPTRVHLVIEYDPDSADADALGLPALLSVGALIDRAVPVVQSEAEAIVERIVADLEGEPREVELEILDAPGSIG